jgi:hypothetical protein
VIKLKINEKEIWWPNLKRYPKFPWRSLRNWIFDRRRIDMRSDHDILGTAAPRSVGRGRRKTSYTSD